MSEGAWLASLQRFVGLVGHWLHSGREAGKFEVVEQQTTASRAWIREGTPQHAAWIDHCRANGRPVLRTQHRVDGDLQTGWWFETEWPPGFDDVKRSGEAS